MGSPGEFGRMLQRFRNARGWTQAQLAQRARIGKDFIAKLESGQRADPRYQIALRIAKALGLSVAAFAGQRTAAVERLVEQFLVSTHAKALVEDGPLKPEELEWLRWVAMYPPFEGRLKPKVLAGLVKLYRDHPELRNNEPLAPPQS